MKMERKNIVRPNSEFGADDWTTKQIRIVLAQSPASRLQTGYCVLRVG